MHRTVSPRGRVTRLLALINVVKHYHHKEAMSSRTSWELISFTLKTTAFHLLPLNQLNQKMTTKTHSASPFNTNKTSHQHFKMDYLRTWLSMDQPTKAAFSRLWTILNQRFYPRQFSQRTSRIPLEKKRLSNLLQWKHLSTLSSLMEIFSLKIHQSHHMLVYLLWTMLTNPFGTKNHLESNYSQLK